MRVHRIAVIIAAAALAASTVAVQAYKLNGPKWAAKEVPFYINPANADVSESAAIAAIQAGAMAWSAQSNASFAFYYMGRTSGSSAGYNAKNEVFFRNEDQGSTIARTYWWYNSRNELVDADIVFYDAGWRFFAGTNGCSDGVYIEDIAVHEFGHALGLGHSSEGDATMYPSVKRCSMDFRTLAADDLAGVEALYPPSGSNALPQVAIQSPSNGANVTEGTALGFTGSASDKEDGGLSSEIVWRSSRDGQIGTGPSFSRVLSTGTHSITASVSDSSGQTSSSSVSVAVQAASTNEPPSVSITAPSSGTSVSEGTSITFNGSGSDAEDGDLTAKLVWTSNLDGTLAMGGSFTRTLSPGAHTIRAAVTDSSGATSDRQISVSVAATEPPTSAPAPAEFWLLATAVKTRGLHHGELRWGGDSSAKVDIYRDGVKVGTTANDGAHTDAINRRGSASYTYKVCAAGTTTCSNAAVISF